MRLSEAIMLGSLTVRAKALGEWYPDGSGCARGMALEACARRITKPDGLVHRSNFRKLWPWADMSVKTPCPCFGADASCSAYGMIEHLFDTHVCPQNPNRSNRDDPDWTLEQLVDWVRSVEPPEPAEQECETVFEGGRGLVTHRA